jgi:regulator of replication initiation timing
MLCEKCNKEIEKPRTGQQNRALHLFFTLLADELNDAGYTVQLVLKEKIDLDWDAHKIKELLWRPAQEAILQKKSTTQLKKQEDIDKVYDHLVRHLGEKFNIFVEFPCEAQLEAQDERFTANKGIYGIKG